MTLLSVNVNKVALLRNQRDIGIPSVTESARRIVAAGAHGITVHPRPDQRHIRPGDVYDLAEMLEVEFNIEGNPFEGPRGTFPGFLEIVRSAVPAQCTLVPDAPEQSTSDHGWDLEADGERLKPIIAELKDLGIRVSLFLDPVIESVDRAAAVGADRIELYTEPYASAFAEGGADRAIPPFAAAAEHATAAGLGVNAGHDLNLENLETFLTSVPGVLEVSIGHALIADALEMGWERTIREYLAQLPGQE